MPFLTEGEFDQYYEIHGQGQPLLLIHGLGSSTRDWELQLPAFQEHFRVLTIDLRGHGRSGKPPGPYTMDIFAEDTANVLKSLHAVPADVVGISLGGMVAFQLVLDHPRLVNRLVIVNSVPELIPRTLRDRLGLWQRLLIINLIGMERMGQVLAERFFSREDQKPLREIFVQRWAENHLPSYRASLKAAYGWSVRDRLGEIQAPTLILGAEFDYFPTAEKEAYTALMPNASLVVVPESKHALPAEKPAEFNQLVTDFLRSELDH
jgi:pimeloyl-ACP methyl ester carboxylesterase